MPDPIRNFRFLVEIDGVSDAGFSEATGFDSTSDVIEYREGKDPAHVRKIPGLTKFGNITLKWGLTDDMRLFDWRQEIVDGKVTRKTVYIIALDETGSEKARWQCDNAWPSKIDPPDFNAKGNDIAINTLEIACEEVKRTK
jgi:phage tail-like protein